MPIPIPLTLARAQERCTVTRFSFFNPPTRYESTRFVQLLQDLVKFELSVRSRQFLTDTGIASVWQLAQWSTMELENAGLHPKCLREIKKMLSGIHLQLDMRFTDELTRALHSCGATIKLDDTTPVEPKPHVVRYGFASEAEFERVLGALQTERGKLAALLASGSADASVCRERLLALEHIDNLLRPLKPEDVVAPANQAVIAAVLAAYAVAGPPPSSAG